MSEVVLASGSLTRKKILEDAGLVFGVEVPNVDEQEIKGALLLKGASGEDIAGFLAEHKSCTVSARVPSAFVIGADQVLECEGEVYSKPEDLVAAKEQLEPRLCALLSPATIDGADRRGSHPARRFRADLG